MLPHPAAPGRSSHAAQKSAILHARLHGQLVPSSWGMAAGGWQWEIRGLLLRCSKGLRSPVVPNAYARHAVHNQGRQGMMQLPSGSCRREKSMGMKQRGSRTIGIRMVGWPMRPSQTNASKGEEQRPSTWPGLPMNQQVVAFNESTSSCSGMTAWRGSGPALHKRTLVLCWPFLTQAGLGGGAGEQGHSTFWVAGSSRGTGSVPMHACAA